MPFRSAITPLASGVRTTSDSATGVDLGVRNGARLVLTCTAKAGTNPTLDVVVETSPDNATWSQAGAFTRVTATGETKLSVVGGSRYLRVRWTISGTGNPSFTFGVAGFAVQAFASISDIGSHAVPSAALAGISDHDKAEGIISASDELWGRFNGRYTGPLTAWGSDLVTHTAEEAACSLLLTRGTNPEAEEYTVLKDLRDGARAWARDVGASKITPDDIIDATPAVEESASVMYTNTKRGW